MARKNAVVTVAIENAVIAITVLGGAEDGTDAIINLDTSSLTDEITERAMYHGLVQKISDAAALGKKASPSDKYHAMLAVTERLASGDWKQSRGEGVGPVAGVIYRAFSQWVADMAKAKKATVPSAEAIRAVYDGKARAEQLALRNVPAIAAIIETLKAAKTPAKTVDTDSLLAVLGL
jgi:hypothetical protein